MSPRRLRSDEGWVLVSAIVLLGIMMTIGLGTLAWVDTGSERTHESRKRESALTVAEGILYAQGFALTQSWPNKTRPLAADCSEASGTTIATCPTNVAAGTGSQLSAGDLQSGVTWTTYVRDNGGPLANAYDPAYANLAQTDPVTGAVCAAPCRADFNGDRQLWVQARATVRGESRNLVARLKLEELRESLPSAGVTAGGIFVSNSGNKNMIDGSGSTVLVRCTDLTSDSCAKWDGDQITPAPQSAPTQPNLLTAAQLQRFKDRAIADGRYYPGCPEKDASGQYDLSGTVVWVEDCPTSPNFANSVKTQPCAVPPGMSPKCVNTPAQPGMLIWHCGQANFQGAFTFVGVLYNANNSDGTCANFPPRSGSCNHNSVQPQDLVVTNGGFGVWGALAIDGGGCLKVGSNGLQLKFDSNAFNAARSYGTVGLVQNTWRELKTG